MLIVIIGMVNILYLLMWFFYNDKDRGYLWTDALWLVIHSGITKFMYERINFMNESGILPEKEYDVFGCNIAA